MRHLTRRQCLWAALWLGGCGRALAEPAGAWREVAPGLELGRWGQHWSVARAWLGRWELRSLPAASGELWAVDAWARRLGAAVACNGGFFDAHRRPMGLRVDQGQAWSQRREADQGIFYVQAGRAGLVHQSRWRGQQAQFALQAGPRLVVQGQALRLRPNLARRTVLGLDPEGRVYLMASREPCDLNPVAQALRAPRAQGGLGLAEALNLDGGPSTWWTAPLEPAGRDELDIQGHAGVADMLALLPRRR